MGSPSRGAGGLCRASTYVAGGVVAAWLLCSSLLGLSRAFASSKHRPRPLLLPRRVVGVGGGEGLLLPPRLRRAQAPASADGTHFQGIAGVLGPLPAIVAAAALTALGTRRTRSKEQALPRRAPLPQALPAPQGTSCSLVACHAVRAKTKGVRVVDGREVPWNIFGPKEPYEATCVSCETITQQTDAPNWETCHVTLRHDRKLQFLEGQSVGVLCPGPDKNGKSPAKVRLYSISSSSVGDNEKSETLSLCIKRLVEVNGAHANAALDEGQTTTPVYRGVASNHMCDMRPGDKVLITGPVGAEMLLPDDPEATIIMLATGTGIAPFRGFTRRLFHDEATKGAFRGLAWLFLGVPFSTSLLYEEELRSYEATFPTNFRVDHAISREQSSEQGEKMYIQTRMAEYGEELWALMQKPNTHVYMCGLKGMQKGIADCFSKLAARDGVVWEDFAQQMKAEKRYHVEVY